MSQYLLNFFIQIHWLKSSHNSSHQLQELRKLSTNPGPKPRAAAIIEEGQASKHEDKERLDFNWRKPQEIYGREVLATFVDEEGHSKTEGLGRSSARSWTQNFWSYALLALVAHFWRKLWTTVLWSSFVMSSLSIELFINIIIPFTEKLRQNAPIFNIQKCVCRTCFVTDNFSITTTQISAIKV